VRGYRSFNNSACKRLLEAGYFRLREVVLKRITITMFEANNGGVNGTDCCGMADYREVDECGNSEV